MDEQRREPPLRPRYRWPWLLLAFLILGLVLAAIWMLFAVRRAAEWREPNPSRPAATQQR